MNECMKFECENMRDNGCNFDDEIVINECSMCDLHCKCDRCKHKEKCTMKNH